MEKKIVIFENPDFGQIRTTCDAQGEPLFCLPDVCKVLNLQASGVKRRLDDGVISTHTVKDSLGRKNLINFVNEDGLYDAILDSRKPEARAFRKWVTAEVLPQIRKTGGYIPLDKDDDEKTILCKAVSILKRTVDQQTELIASQGKEIARLTPKAEYAEEVLLSPTCYTMTEVAKSLSLTVQELQYRLHKWGFIYRAPSGCWMLYAPFLKQGYEAYRTRMHEDLNEKVPHTETYLVWTERGKEYIHSMFNQLAA